MDRTTALYKGEDLIHHLDNGKGVAQLKPTVAVKEQQRSATQEEYDKRKTITQSLQECGLHIRRRKQSFVWHKPCREQFRWLYTEIKLHICEHYLPTRSYLRQVVALDFI